MAVADDEANAGFVAVTDSVESACSLNGVGGADGAELPLEVSSKLLGNGLYSRSP
jgi:hypothetical protein